MIPALPAALAVALLGAAPAKPAVAIGEPPPGPTVALAVSPDQVIAPVSRSVLGGFNFGNWMQVVDFAEDLRQVKPAELRFPGGNIGDDHDLSEFALGAFQANLSLLGSPRAVIHTRVFAGGISAGSARNRPEDAADAVRWAKAKGITVSYWQIGNEPDLYGVTRGDPSWTPAKYCQVFRAQRAAILAVDPEARVAGPGVSGGRPARDRFLDAFVAECGDVIDVLNWHVYPTDGTLSDEAAFATVREADETVDRALALWKDPARNPKGHGRPVELAVTEYGLSYQSNRMQHLADLPAAMWAMEMAFRLDARKVVSAHYFALQATGGHGLLDVAGARRPSYYAFALLAKLSGNLVAASTTDPELWTHAARDGERLDVVVTNRARQPRTLAVGVPGFALRSGEYFDEAITRAEKPPAALQPGAAVTLPARSVTHLVYRRK